MDRRKRITEWERQRGRKQYRDALGPRPVDVMHADRLEWPTVWRAALRPFGVAGTIIVTGGMAMRLLAHGDGPPTVRMLAILVLSAVAGFLAGIALAAIFYGSIRALALLDRWLTSLRER